MVIKIQSQIDAERPFTLLAWGHWFAFANLILALILSVFYFGPHPAPETFVGWFYLFITWVGHFAFLALACFILTIFPVITIFPYKRHVRGVSAVMASFFQLYLFLDVLAYRGLGYHLTNSSLDQLREVEDVYLNSLGSGYWVLLIAVFITILAYQALLSNYTWKNIAKLQAIRFKNQLAQALFACFFLSHSMHIWADATLNVDIARQASMFPASYPLTAKSLLARHGLIDLNEYKQTKSAQAQFNNSANSFVPSYQEECSLADKPQLNVYLINLDQLNTVKTWLEQNNVAFSWSRQMVVSSDLDTNLFSFNSGLPGLYDGAESDNLSVNNTLGMDLVNVQIHPQQFEPKDAFDNLSNKKAFVFFDTSTQDKFYRTELILVGLDAPNEQAISPQNLIATYINDHLQCPSYVNNNLIDVPFSQLNSDEIITNYADGYFHFIYKDKAMLFEQGQLLSSKTFSSNKKVEEPINIYVVEQAVKKINKKRQKN